MGTLYIVMGAGGTRKSATIRALTGYMRRNPWEVGLADGTRRLVWVIPTSPQESHMAFDSHLSAIRERGRDRAMDILLALHPPNANEYISEIPEENRETIRWVLLGREYNESLADVAAPLADPDAVIEGSRRQPANAIAHEIRQVWRWL